MFIATPFTEIEVGELDYRGFDFTSDLGNSTITATSWTCTLASGGVTDPDPQSHIISSGVYTQIANPTPSSPTGPPVSGTLYGGFSVALLGGFTSACVGGTYLLEATANLSDGRVLKVNTTITCAAPGI